ncbi:MAG: hypothetical protein LC772_06925, partial [Chloroflexi bacterium]|nr:hypothetical protein [Chloroflexota bacterium]
FEGLFQHGAKGFFQNFLGGFDQMLQQMAAKWMAAQAMMAIGHALGGSKGGGGAGGAFLNIGTSILDGMGLGGARAGGGPMDAGRAYLVGERGPEIVVPRQGGMVIPNGAGMGTVVNQHFYITAPDSSSFRQSRTQIETEYARGMSRAASRNR